jgi:hypothetical protein
MDLQQALRQIDEIHRQIAHAEVFRGYKAATVGATGMLALAAAAVQASLVQDPSSHLGRYLALWLGVATVCVLMVGLELAACWLRAGSAFRREQIVRAVEQFAPCLLAGAAITLGIVRYLPTAVPALPGIWSIVFSLGIFASWRLLTPQILYVAAYYLAAGSVCLAVAQGEDALSPWTMAGTFGVGQLLTAVVLYLGLEARHVADE